MTRKAVPHKRHSRKKSAHAKKKNQKRRGARVHGKDVLATGLVFLGTGAALKTYHDRTH